MVQQDDDGRWDVKLVDLGLARTVDASQEAMTTDSGRLPGTPEYLHNEALRAKREITGRSDTGELRDVAAVGLTLYQMLVGERLEEPFPTSSKDRALAGLPCSEALREILSRTILVEKVVNLKMAVLRRDLRALTRRADDHISQATVVEDPIDDQYPIPRHGPTPLQAGIVAALALVIVAGTALVWSARSRPAGDAPRGVPSTIVTNAAPSAPSPDLMSAAVSVDAVKVEPAPGPSTAALDTGTSGQLFGVAADGSGRVFAVGRRSPILVSRDNGDHWTPDRGAEQAWLYGAWTDGHGAAFFVGDKGTILRWPRRKGVLMSAASGTNETLMAVWGSGPNDVYAVGEHGTIRHTTDGWDWRPETVPVQDGLRAIWGNGPDDVWTVGWGGAIFHKRQSKRTLWEWVRIGTEKPWFYGVWGAGPDDLYVVGAPCEPPEKGEESHCPAHGGLIVHTTDGFQTRPLIIERSEARAFTAVWGTSAKDVYVAGANDVILHSADEGLTWQPFDHPPIIDRTTHQPAKFSAISGAGDAVWFAGSEGTVIRYRRAGAQR